MQAESVPTSAAPRPATPQPPKAARPAITATAIVAAEAKSTARTAFGRPLTTFRAPA